VLESLPVLFVDMFFLGSKRSAGYVVLTQNKMAAQWRVAKNPGSLDCKK